MNIKNPTLNSEGVVAQCYQRIEEIENGAVKLPKTINTDYIKKLNAYIFQDMTALNVDYAAGQFRAAAPIGDLNISNRPLSNGDSIYCMRSFMDENALKRFNDTLKSIKPDEFNSLTTKEFTNKIADIYANLDYTHPFVDGNSRTFRTFTKQIATASGFDLNWGKISVSNELRDDLYCARALGAAQIALKDPDQSKYKEYIRNIIDDINYPAPRKNLNYLLLDLKLVKPFRALEFREAVQKSISETGNNLPKFIPELEKNLNVLNLRYPEMKVDNEKLVSQLKNEFEKKEPLTAYAVSLKIIAPAYSDLFSNGLKNLSAQQINNAIKQRKEHLQDHKKTSVPQKTLNLER